MRPTYVFAAAFVGLVGSAVIAATTLFIGYKSVEVVSNDTITTAEASISLEGPVDGSHDLMPMVNANEGFDDDVSDQSLLLAFAKMPKMRIWIPNLSRPPAALLE